MVVMPSVNVSLRGIGKFPAARPNFFLGKLWIFQGRSNALHMQMKLENTVNTMLYMCKMFPN